MPKFSIIIPVYNVAPYLRECLDSVLAQTFTDWEAICVDDGSTDGSGAILDEYEVKDKRFRVIHQNNGGVSSARNVALDVAQGEWVWFVDGDDAIHPQALECLTSMIIEHEDINHLVIADTCSYDMEFDRFSSMKLSGDHYVANANSLDANDFVRIRRAGWAVLHRRSIIGGTRFAAYRIGEDVLFLFQVFWKTRKVLVSDAAVYYYRQREGSAVSRAPRLQEVDDFLSTEIELSKMLRMNRRFWTQNGIKKYLLWNNEFGFVTFNGMFLRISNSDRSMLVKKWVELQVLNNELLPFSLKRKAQYFIVKCAPCGLSAYVAISAWDGLKRRVKRVFMKNA